MNSLINADITNAALIRLILILTAIICIIYGFTKKHYFYSMFLLLMVIFSTTRDQNFHRLPTWYIVVLVIVLCLPHFKAIYPRITLGVGCVLSLFMVSGYMNAVSTYLLSEKNRISELEAAVIDITESGEAIYMDAFSYDTIYFMYKDRLPANRSVYMLPWYMDWYENWAVEDLITKQPQLVIFNEAQKTWGHTYYANYFLAILQQYYTRQSDSTGDWEYKLWIRNDEPMDPGLQLAFGMEVEPETEAETEVETEAETGEERLSVQETVRGSM